jgi:hypothetical protein
MLIEELIRLGRPVLESGLDPREVLKLITDAADERVKNFYRHVIVVELPPKGNTGEPAVLPVQNWQEEQRVKDKKKPEIKVDVQRALGAPFILPTGNPINAQGRYIPAYPAWGKHFLRFRESPEAVTAFLAKRLARTPNFSMNQAFLNRVGERLHQAVVQQYDGR